MGIINITDRGYELRNPANDQYMGGFFKYETEGLTYTGFEVFIENDNELGRFEKDLKKYFSPKNEYGSKKLGYTERDVDFVSLVGAKVVGKDGKIVSDMLGFSHYDKNMKILGSTGIDKADPSKPYYIEVVGEFKPGVTSNITPTTVDDKTAATMQNLIMTASDAILYGEESSNSNSSSSGSSGSSSSAPTQIINAKAGELVKIKYDASDAGLVTDATFTFRNSAGKDIQLKDYDNDGVATLRLDANAENGEYVLDEISFSDYNASPNRSNYVLNSHTGKNEIRALEQGKWNTSTHNFDLPSLKFTVSGGKPAQTDFKAPVLNKLPVIDKSAVKAGELVKIKYDASDAGLVTDATFTFRNSAGKDIQLKDYDNDGVATLRLDANAENGEYVLDEISFSDYNASPNRSNYVLNSHTGKNEIRALEQGKWNTSTYNFDLSSLKFTVGAKQNITDTAKPTLTSFAPEKATAKLGEYFTINYVADGTGSDLTDVRFNMRNDSGQRILFQDKDGDGKATILLDKNSSLKDGEYKFVHFNVGDAAGNGINGGRGSESGKFDNIKFTLTKPSNMNAAQTDFDAPELISFEPFSEIV